MLVSSKWTQMVRWPFTPDKQFKGVKTPWLIPKGCQRNSCYWYQAVVERSNPQPALTQTPKVQVLGGCLHKQVPKLKVWPLSPIDETVELQSFEDSARRLFQVKELTLIAPGLGTVTHPRQTVVWKPQIPVTVKRGIRTAPCAVTYSPEFTKKYTFNRN